MHTMKYYAGLEKGRNPPIHNNMDESGQHCAKKNKPVTEGQLPYDSLIWDI